MSVEYGLSFLKLNGNFVIRQAPLHEVVIKHTQNKFHLGPTGSDLSLEARSLLSVRPHLATTGDYIITNII